MPRCVLSGSASWLPIVRIGVERRVRLLEDESDLFASDPAELFTTEGQDIAPFPKDVAALYAARARQEPHEREGEHGFAGAGLAHERNRLTCIERE